MRLLEWIPSLSKLLARLALHFAVIGMSALVLVVLFAVVARSLMNQPPVWTEEFCRYLFVWVTLIGATSIYQSGEHIVVDLVLKAFPQAAVKYMLMFINTVVGLLAYFMLVEGIAIAARTMAQKTSVMQIPFGYVYAAIPLSGLLFVIHAVNGFIEAGKGEKTLADISRAVGEL